MGGSHLIPNQTEFSVADEMGGVDIYCLGMFKVTKEM